MASFEKVFFGLDGPMQLVIGQSFAVARIEGKNEWRFQTDWYFFT